MSLDREKKDKEFDSKLKNFVQYSITINPSEQFPTDKSRMLNVYSSLITLFRKQHLLKYVKHIELHTEVSYPMKNGLDKKRPCDVISRIHYHGTITFVDVVGFFVYVQPSLSAYCIYEIDTLDDSDNWTNYVTKDKDEWKGREQEPFTEYIITEDILDNVQKKRRKTNEKDNEVNIIPLLEDDRFPFYYAS